MKDPPSLVLLCEMIIMRVLLSSVVVSILGREVARSLDVHRPSLGISEETARLQDICVLLAVRLQIVAPQLYELVPDGGTVVACIQK